MFEQYSRIFQKINEIDKGYNLDMVMGEGEPVKFKEETKNRLFKNMVEKEIDTRIIVCSEIFPTLRDFLEEAIYIDPIKVYRADERPIYHFQLLYSKRHKRDNFIILEAPHKAFRYPGGYFEAKKSYVLFKKLEKNFKYILSKSRECTNLGDLPSVVNNEILRKIELQKYEQPVFSSGLVEI